MEKTTHNSAQNFIAKFSVSCELFLLFSFCASGENSVAKSQRVLQAKRYGRFWRKKLQWKLGLWKLLLEIVNWRKLLSKKCWSKNLNWNFCFLIQDFLNRKFSSAKLNTSHWLDQINLSSSLLDFVYNCFEAKRKKILFEISVFNCKIYLTEKTQKGNCCILE